ncbi:hypothetical protein NBT05_08510 [Aquimarina sp. ERC-38]|uniref:hypothetical protein n=1 Tax=Aquimarina sp. ERC-38 TaxID=2949996 RepID=UPI002246BB92|nr:hypothetical protein [Aquimarina sp. ERC-38]UZO82504.1 hypothetical protein NBT05_08510 [Aquimarina sp. ERC-38]
MLDKLISVLSKEEKKKFIKYLKSRNKRNDSKNIKLFDLLSSNPLIKHPDVHLYDHTAKNQYYAVVNRLTNNLIDFIAVRHLDEEETKDVTLIKWIATSRVLLQHNEIKEAFNLLEKAEKKAIKGELYTYLHEIYQIQIQYAHLQQKETLDQILGKLRGNQIALQRDSNLTVLYASIKQVLIRTDIAQQSIPLDQVIRQILNQTGIIITADLSFKALYQLIHLFSEHATVRRDFYTVLPFMEECYRIFKDKLKTIANTEYQIEILYIIGNAFFRNKYFLKAWSYVKEAEQLIKNTSNKPTTSSRNIYLLKSLLYNYTGASEKAILLLESIKKGSTRFSVDFEFKVHLSLLVFYFQQEQYKKSLRIFSLFEHTDAYYQKRIGQDWIVKKDLVEILLRIELEQIGLVASRLASFLKKHKKYLRAIHEDRVLTFVSLITYYHKHPEKRKTKYFIDKIEVSFKWKEHSQEDIYVMSFYAWLKSRTSGGSLYTVTLDLINAT